MHYSKLSGLYTKVPDVWEHSLHVFLYNSVIIRDLSFISDEQKQDILVASLLHDIGKVTWPAKWFSCSRNEISHAEWLVIQAHPIQGLNLLNILKLPVTNQVKTIILNHHERPGEKGYPNKTEPDLPTLIFSACNTFCSNIESRPYRPIPMSKSNALDTVAEFAPKVIVDLIKKNFTEVA